MNKKTLCTFIVTSTFISFAHAVLPMDSSNPFGNPKTAPHSPGLEPEGVKQDLFKQSADAPTVLKTAPHSPTLNAHDEMPHSADELKENLDLDQPALSLQVSTRRASLTPSPQSKGVTPRAVALGDANPDPSNNLNLLEEMAKRFKLVGSYEIIPKPSKKR
jgi:hypothetical protein